jgi:hypothetical protein
MALDDDAMIAAFARSWTRTAARTSTYLDRDAAIAAAEADT